VGHTGFPVSLMPGSYQIRDIYRYGCFGRIRKQQDPEPVFEVVFCDALYGSHFSNAFGQGNLFVLRLGKRPTQQANQHDDRQLPKNWL